MRVYVEGDTPSTDVPPTDTKVYLHFSSDHPEHTKNGIPSGLAMRARRICSSDVAFERQTLDIRRNLRSRGYSDEHNKKGMGRAGAMSRSTLLKGETYKKRKEGTPLVVPFSSHLPNINRILRNKKSILQRSETLKKIFKDDTFVSYKRGTNLADVLVHKRLRV